MGNDTHSQPVHPVLKTEKTDVHAALYQSLLHNPTLGFWVLDADGRFRQVNDAYLRRSGYTRQELLGQPISMVQATQAAAGVVEHPPIIKEQGHHQFESVHRTKTGETWPVEVNATFADGHIFAILQDVTERKKIESELRQKSSALENSLNGFDIVSADGKILYANRAYLAMWGYSSLDEILGASPADHCADPTVPAEIIQNLETHGAYSLAFTAKRKDGSTFEVMMAAKKMVDDNGTVTYAGTSIDITALLQAQQTLQESERRYQTLAELTTDYAASFRLGENGRLRPEWITGDLVGVTGYTLAEIDAKGGLIAIMHPDDQEKAHANMAQMMQGHSFLDEFRIIHKNGQTRWLQDHAYAELDPDTGKPARFYTAVRDITDRKNMEEALRQSQAQLAGIFDSALDAIISMDENQHIVFFNAAAEQLFGYAADDVIGQSHDMLLPGRYQNAHKQHVRQFSQSSQTQRKMNEIDTLVGRRANGEEFPVEVSISRVEVGKKTFYTAIMRDITERKQAEQALRDSEERLELALKGADLGLWDWNLTNNHVIYNARWAEILGYSSDELDPHFSTWEKLIHPDDVPDVMETLHAHLNGRTDAYEVITRLRAKSGEWKWIQARGRVLQRDAGGKPVRMAGTHLDITDRKRAVDALRASEEKLQLFINHAPAALAMFDREMRYLSASHRWLADYGLEQQTIIGRSHYDVFPEIPDRWKAIHQRGMAGAVIRADEDPFPRLDGHTQWLRWEVRPWYMPNEEVGGIVVFSEDITEWKEAETAVQEMQVVLAEAEAVANSGSWKWDILAEKATWSDGVYDIFGINCQTFTGDAYDLIQTRVHPEDLEKANQAAIDTFINHQPCALEFRLLLPDGTERVIWEEGRVQVDENGRAIAMIGYIQDITERKRAEAKIAELQAILSQAETIAKIGSWKWDLATQALTWSDEMYTLFGVDPTHNELDLGQIIQERIHPDDIAAVEASNASVLDTHHPIPLEYRVVLPDGTERVVWAEGRLVQNEAGQPTALFGYVQDITARKQAEQAIRDSEQRYHTLLENMLEGCQIIDFDWRYRYLNPSLAKHARLPAAHLLGNTMMDVYPGIEDTDLFAILDRCMTQRRHYFLENKFEYADGSFAWFDLSIQPVPEGLFILSIDITERKEAEEALRQSEERFSKAFQLSPAALSLTREDGTILDVNESYERLSGYSREELIDRDVTALNLFTKAQRADLRQRMIAAGNRLREAELTIRNKAGEMRHVLYSVEAVDIKGDPCALTLAFDITRRKQMELDLKEMASNMAAAQAMTHHGSWEIQLTSDLEFIDPQIWSDECYRIFGMEPRSIPITIDFFYQHVHPDDRVNARQILNQLVQQGGEVEYEYRLVRPDGSVRSLLDRAMVVVDEQTNRPLKVVGLVRDITESKQAEATIAQLNQRMELILDSAGEGIYGTDVDGRITFINPAMAAMLGWEPEQLRGHDAHTMFHHSHPDGAPYPAAECTIKNVIQKGEEHHNLADLFWRQDGSPVFVDYTCTPTRIDGETVGTVMVVRDVTERQKAAEAQALLSAQLRQAQKMESIGRLAGGVAHDFNNQLAIIKLYGDLMRNKMDANDPLLPKLAQIRRAVDRAANLTRQLLAFSRKQVLQPVSLNMNDLVANLEKMLSRLIGEDITLSTNLQPDLWSVMADPGQIEQVIMNLVINARDAMPTGGMLTVETRNVPPKDIPIPVHPDMPEGYCVMLVITDTGHGMEADIREQIFEPFFTTKQPGKGTGLGLATVHGIVKQSGGAIYVYSEPDRGTTFKIYLPADQNVMAQLTAPDTAVIAAAGSETVLLVEDEPALRELIQETLAEIGYTVLSAADGEEALIIAQDHPTPIDLLLSDVVLPQMSGREIAEALTAVQPHLKVLFISGYMDDAIMRHGVLTADVNFLSKPFARSTLASKVRDVLDKPA